MVLADIQPFSVLIEHGVDDVGKGFVGMEKPVAPRQQVAFQPADEGVFGKHLHNAAIAGELAAVCILRQHIRHPGLLAYLVDSLKPVRGGLVRAKYAEARHVVFHHVAQVLAEGLGILVFHRAAGGNVYRIVAKIRQLEFLAQEPAVGMRVGAHAPVPPGRQCLEFGYEPAVCIEQLFMPVAAHPVFQEL
ncbi:MAG: hypothetical protein HCAMLNBO_00227 [Candidatus Brocadia fulgida]|nr:hypothetical protein [Candidatus Brocadia fulgida]